MQPYIKYLSYEVMLLNFGNADTSHGKWSSPAVNSRQEVFMCLLVSFHTKKRIAVTYPPAMLFTTGEVFLFMESIEMLDNFPAVLQKPSDVMTCSPMHLNQVQHTHTHTHTHTHQVLQHKLVIMYLLQPITPYWPWKLKLNIENVCEEWHWGG